MTRYLFIIQGEGRGHLTQAMTLEKLLREDGRKIELMLVGRSPSRKLPSFFTEGIDSPMEQFESVNFVPSSDNRKPDYAKTGLYNLMNLTAYFPSIQLIMKRIKEVKPDVVVNFYDILGTHAYHLSRTKAPLVCLGHQFLFKHSQFKFPSFGYEGHLALNMFSDMISLKAAKVLALSFREMPSEGRLRVVPPLLRMDTLKSIPVSDDGAIHGYLLNAGFSEDVIKWHKSHPETPARFYWDRPDKIIDERLSFHALDDQSFLEGLSKCHAYASTAGFESICEAMYLGKPLLMVPSHLEQKCNAFDATNYGRQPENENSEGPRPACSSERFDLDLLTDFAENRYSPDPMFRPWVESAEEIFKRELTEF